MLKTFKAGYVLKASVIYTLPMTLVQLAYAIGQYYVWTWLLKNYSWAHYLVFHEYWVLAWTIYLVVDALLSFYIRKSFTKS